MNIINKYKFCLLFLSLFWPPFNLMASKCNFTTMVSLLVTIELDSLHEINTRNIFDYVDGKKDYIYFIELRVTNLTNLELDKRKLDTLIRNTKLKYFKKQYVVFVVYKYYRDISKDLVLNLGYLSNRLEISTKPIKEYLNNIEDRDNKKYIRNFKKIKFFVFESCEQLPGYLSREECK